MKDTESGNCDCAWTWNFSESVSAFWGNLKRFEIDKWFNATKALSNSLRCSTVLYTHSSSLPRFICMWIYILIAFVRVLPITKVNKCKSWQRAGNAGVETAAAIVDRNREVCERMCHSNMIHSAYILMQAGKHLSCFCVWFGVISEFSICYK